MKCVFSMMIIILFFIMSVCCNSSDIAKKEVEVDNNQMKKEETKNLEKNKGEERKIFNYLALGDSYTKGEAVEISKSFPVQFTKELEGSFDGNVETKIIAKTGWRTDELIAEIERSQLKNNFDFVTLLIGVNNQFQGINFNIYEKEFTQLLETSIKLVGGDKKKVLTLSIPDYAFTPFGKGNQKISKEIDKYNAFAKEATREKEVDFLEITDITRRGLDEPELVAGDDLHISAKVYKEIVDRILKLKFEKLDRSR